MIYPMNLAQWFGLLTVVVFAVVLWQLRQLKSLQDIISHILSAQSQDLDLAIDFPLLITTCQPDRDEN
jgi:hypothetical protein